MINDSFTLRQVDAQNITIQASNIVSFQILKSAVKTIEGCQSSTFTPSHQRPKNLVLKGVYGDYDEKDVKLALKALNFQQATITKVVKIKYDKKDESRYFFMVQVTSDSKTLEITRCICLLSQVVHWQRLRKRGPFPCIKCQRFRHTSQICNCTRRCVKCSGDHDPKQCSLALNAPKENIKCANCNHVGHPASYKGCIYYKNATLIHRNMTYSKPSTKRASKTSNQRLPIHSH